LDTSPYARETYRYTPLLALLLAPNEWVHPSFGKYLFAGCDILNGALIYNMLLTVILPKCLSRRSHSQSKEKADDTLNAKDTIDRLATFYTAMHLFNPLVFAISTRGSSESVLSSFILLTLWYALKGRWDAAAVLLGVSTHWKIYPVIFGAGSLGVIGNDEAGEGKEKQSAWKSYLSTIVNWRTLRFAGLSAGSFFLLGVLCYLM
jgi:phosphatidylinositol glycan class M